MTKNLSEDILQKIMVENLPDLNRPTRSTKFTNPEKFNFNNKDLYEEVVRVIFGRRKRNIPAKIVGEKIFRPHNVHRYDNIRQFDVFDQSTVEVYTLTPSFLEISTKRNQAGMHPEIRIWHSWNEDETKTKLGQTLEFYSTHRRRIQR